MDNYHIPYDITSIILTKMNKSTKYLFDDEVLLKFIIKYSHIHAETLLIWFVKQQRQQALVLYTKVKLNKVLAISDNVLIFLCRTTIKNNNTDILKYILDTHIERIKCNTNIFNNIVNLVIEVYLIKKCMKWVEILNHLLKLNNRYVINNYLLLKVLEKDKTKKLVRLLQDNQCIYSNTTETKVIYYTIVYNHLSLLKDFIVNGYEISIYDVIVGILSSNRRVVRYITTYFKPRLYTKGFRRMLLSTATKRNDKLIYKYIYERLK